jgi:hypothetical protein
MWSDRSKSLVVEGVLAVQKMKSPDLAASVPVKYEK